MVYIITSKTRRSKLPHGRTVAMDRRHPDEQGSLGTDIVDERKADEYLRRHQHGDVYHDPRPIPGYTEHQKP